ncbi:TetR/AcrR family transcriptional regulator [Amycolatopsis sp. NPDC059021]|uniref:TetR/AcrR family transcriptional regulator n=1 Tax=Amycolatopsis sp. NPDC059021 TaxID=3346704 RepID=UPI00366EF14C
MARRTRDPECRHRLTAGAWRLVARHGVEATTVRAIAAEAGVSTGSVTHYFEDKAELMSSVLRYNNKLATEQVLAAVGDATGLEAVRRGVEALLPLDEARLRTWTVWLAFWGDRAAHELTAKEGGGAGYGALTGWLTRVFTDAVAAGELPSTVDPRHETDRILVLLGGLGLLTGGSPALLGQVARLSRRMLADHLAQLSPAYAAG